MYSSFSKTEKLFIFEKLLYTLYPKWEFKKQFKRLLEQLSLFYCLFVEIESEFK